MFGSDDQNQSSQAMPATDVPATDSAAPVDAVMPSSASPADMPTQNISTEPDVVASAPSAPTIPDPMVTPSAQPMPGVNGMPMETVYTEPMSQIGPAKPSESVALPSAASVISTPYASASTAIDPDLAQIKQQALQSLGPLVGQLDQAPDEKFKTVMMLIQASDNSKMLGSAYEAASQITDEKTRAQALLDIVNEINYFTAQAQKQ